MHLTGVPLRCVMCLDDMDCKAIEITRRLQAIGRGSPQTNWIGDVARLVEAAAGNGRMTCASVDWPRPANKLPTGCVAIVQGGALGARVHRDRQASTRVTMVVDGDVRMPWDKAKF